MRNERGNVLLILACVMAVLSTVFDSVMMTYDANTKSLDAFRAKKQAFYVSEGVRSLATVMLENYLMNNPDPHDDEIAAYLKAQLAEIIPSPYSVPDVSAQIIKTTPNATITSGPFKGMVGPITYLLLKFNVVTGGGMFGGNLAEPLELRLSIGYISMFQFMTFYDVTQAIITTGPDMDMNGRVHANGDLCIGGTSGWQRYLKLTVGGRLMSNADTRCEGGNNGTSRTRIATDATFTTFADFANAYDNGCTNCNSSRLAWDAFAISRWHEQAMDKAHGVQVLKLPGAGIGSVQLQEAGTTTAVNNTDNLRFVIDPVLPSDSATVQSYKFAHNADIRIINGVWYLKDKTDPTSWPGVPVWSDHPGRFHEFDRDVGQDDIRDRWASTPRPWPSAPLTPRGFSYYEYDASNHTIFDDSAGVGVISYGTLANSGATGAGSTPQKPAQWVTDTGTEASALCFPNAPPTTQKVSCSGGCGLKSVWGTTLTCSGPAFTGRDPGYATSILNATRSGFRNGHINDISPGDANTRRNRSRVLPVNFDVQQFQNALRNTNAGELGSYFGAGSFMGEEFNGIVYISSVWPHANDGYGAGAPAEPQFHGSINDVNQIPRSHTANERGLPQPFCSTSRAGENFDEAGGRQRFKIPDCANYVSNGSYPTVLRVVNGYELDRTTLSKGLSLVSNLPVYLVGDYNRSSQVSSVNATPWTPSLVAGDKVALVSNNWTDERSRWDVEPSTVSRPASDTTFNTAMLTEPSETLTILLENWTSRNLRMNGSMVYGYNAVYALHENKCCGNATYDPPDRTFVFDPHYGLITNQPPGTPVFPVSATGMWTKPK